MQPNLVKQELHQRLRVGGRWYNRGAVLLLEKSDADIYKSRGISVDAKPGSKADNQPEEEQKVEKDETITASQLGIVTRNEVRSNVQSTRAKR